MVNLLNIDANPKTVKGQKRGYMTAVLYLAPYIAAGPNVCPFAKSAGCWRDCLNVAGRGGMSKGNARFDTATGISLPDNAIQHARIRRTELFHNDRDAFMNQLLREVEAFCKRAWRKGLTPCVRLNGTSDIAWEKIDTGRGMSVFDQFPTIQFYDYTKNYKRAREFLAGNMPANYYLCQSYSQASQRFAAECWNTVSLGASLVIVARDNNVKDRLISQHNGIDGDETDLRFTDPRGSIVVLKAKGSARRDYSGFVID